MSRLSTKLGKIELANPVTVASGTFGLEYSDFFDINQLGAYVTKTITKQPKVGNPPPRLYETDCGLLNSIGLQNPGVDEFINNILPALSAKLTIPIIVSFSGSTIDEFCEVLVCLEKQEGITAYEINISCPNVENEGIAFGVDASVVFNLTKRLSGLTNRELIVKLSPNVTDITKVALAAQEGGATSLALINTLYGMAIDWKTGNSFIKNKIAGYSGRGIKPVALANTFKVAQVVKIPILAMGGICNWQDALEFFYAGASAIAIGTQHFIDPLASIKVLNKLKSHFDERECYLKDIIGKVYS